MTSVLFFSSPQDASQYGIKQMFKLHTNNPIFRNAKYDNENIAVGTYYIRRSALKSDHIVLVLNTNAAQNSIEKYRIQVINADSDLKLSNIRINGISLSNRKPAITTIAQLISALESDVIPTITNNPPKFVSLVKKI